MQEISQESVLDENDIQEKKPNFPLQKDHPLLVIWKSDLSLQEFKIIDIYLTMTTARSRHFSMKKSELEKRLHVQRIRASMLMEHLQTLRMPIVDEYTKKKGISLFKVAAVSMKRIELIGTPELFRIFNKDIVADISKDLPVLIQFTRRFIYLLYRYLTVNRECANWIVSLEEIRSIMGCTGKTYDQYKFFNNKALKIAYDEINKNTNLKFTYDPIRDDGEIVAIRFVILDSNDSEKHLPSEESNSAEGGDVDE